MDAERHYHERMRLFKGEAVEPGGIVLLGSSHVEWFDVASLLPGRFVINRGIAGDRLDADNRGVLHRLEVSVFACQPAAVVFESGTNDLGELWRHGRPAMPEVVELYRQAVESVRVRLPSVPMALVSVFPTRGAYAGMSSLVPVFNGHLPEIAAEHRGAYLDVHALLADSAGELSPEYTEDGLHLNERGYRVWADEMERWLDGLSPAL